MIYVQPCEHEILILCRFSVGHRLQHWPNNKQTSSQRLVLAGRRIVRESLMCDKTKHTFIELTHTLDDKHHKDVGIAL